MVHIVAFRSAKGRSFAEGLADRNQHLLAESYLDKALGLCEEGDIARGLLWLAQSLETTPARSKDLDQAIRLNLGAWAPPMPQLRRVMKFDHEVWTVAFSRDGKLMLTAEQELNQPRATVRLWDTATGEPVGVPIRCRGAKEIALSPDGKVLATGWDTDINSNFDAQLWDTATGKVIRDIPLPANGNYSHGSTQCPVAFSGDGKILLTPNGQVVDVATGIPCRAPGKGFDTRIGEHISCFAVSHDGKFVATGDRHLKERSGWVHSVQLWNLALGGTHGARLPWPAAPYYASAMAITSDGKTVATGGEDGVLRVWDVATGKSLAESRALTGGQKPSPIHSLAISADGTTILTGHAYGHGAVCTARLWNASTGEPIGLAMPHDREVEGVVFHPGGKLFLTASKEKIVRLWELPDRSVAAIDLPTIADLAFSPDGQRMVTGGGDKTGGVARLLERTTGKPLSADLLPGQGTVFKVAYSPDGKTFATVSRLAGERELQGAVVHFWNAATGQAVGRPLECEGLRVVDGAVTWWWTIRGLAFDSELTTLTTTETGYLHDGKVRKWDLQTGKLIGELHPGEATEGLLLPVVSPDGKRRLKLLQSDFSATLSGPGPSDGGQVQHRGAVIAGAFSPDGVCFLTGSQDNTARLWHTTTLRPIGPTIKLEPTNAPIVAISPDGQTFLTGSRLQPMPPVVPGDAARIVLWIQVLTGAELHGMQFHGLSAEERLARQQRLEELGGPPVQ